MAVKRYTRPVRTIATLYQPSPAPQRGGHAATEAASQRWLWHIITVHTLEGNLWEHKHLACDGRASNPRPQKTSTYL